MTCDYFTYMYDDVCLVWSENLLLSPSNLLIRCSVTAITSRSHRGNRGSTPRFGVNNYFFVSCYFSGAPPVAEKYAPELRNNLHAAPKWGTPPLSRSSSGFLYKEKPHPPFKRNPRSMVFPQLVPQFSRTGTGTPTHHSQYLRNIIDPEIILTCFGVRIIRNGKSFCNVGVSLIREDRRR